MDEPFGAIDPITRAVLQDEFLRIQEKLKKTIIFVTHDIDEAIKMGDKICLLRDGRLEQYGTPNELLTAPKNDFVKSFVGADRALKRLNLLTVSDAMMKEPIHCHASDLASEVHQYMGREDLSYLLVLDSENVLEGYVSHRDLTDYSGPVEKLVRPMTLTVAPDWNLKDALSKMLQFDLGILCVVNEKGQLLGVLNSRTLLATVGETYDDKGGHWGRILTGGRAL
jgi:osmoprotectant transport system ATP-binding protein